MKLVAGIGDISDYESFVKAGAKEVFCGFVPLEWNEKYGTGLALNRREVLFYNVNISSYSDMIILKRMEQKYKVPVSIAFNSLYYTPAQLEDIERIMLRLINIGFNTFIIADIALYLYISSKKMPVNVIISGEAGEISEPFEKLLAEYENNYTKISRIIFSRNVSVNDMRAVINKTAEKYEYEAFFLNEKCEFTGAYCNSFHCDELVHMCQMPYELACVRKDKDEIIKRWQNRSSEVECEIGNDGCGMCALWDLKNAGVTHLKIVGRGKAAETMFKDIAASSEALRILDESTNKSEYITRMKNSLSLENCSGNCYYSE